MIRSLIVILLFSVAFVPSGCATRRADYAKPDHYDGRRFHNVASVPEESFWEDVRVSWELMRKRAKWPDHISIPPHRIADASVSNGIRATFIGHSTVLLQMSGLNILTDPVLFERIGPNRLFSQRRITDAGVKISDLPHIDVVLISHDHYDHLDLPTLEQIEKRQASNPPKILVGLGNKLLLTSHGLSNVDELDWGNDVTIGSVRIHFLEAVHTSRRGLFDTNKTLWGAFLIESSNGNVYFAGDTAYSSHFQRVFEQYGPVKLALLPIGAYKPRWFMYREHMNPAEAVQAHLDLHSGQSIGIHLKAFHAAAEGYEEPVIDLRASLQKHHVPTNDFKVIGPGESLDIPRGFTPSLNTSPSASLPPPSGPQ